MRWLLHLLSRTHRAEMPRERALCKARRALGGVRAESIWLGERPFSDKNGYDQVGYGRTSREVWTQNDGEQGQGSRWKR
jgi:hypothetical protein